MESLVQIGGHADGLGKTTRKDRWWSAPLIQGFVLAALIGYTNWAVFQGEHYWHESYLSPMYSPVLMVDPDVPGAAPMEHVWFGLKPDGWPRGIPFSPGFLIMLFPIAFRGSCYYYRKAYYRAYFSSPPACAVGGARRHKYKGETGLFLFQNLHRYALYCALPYIPILYWDAIISFFENGDIRHGALGVGVGSIVLLLNATLLASFTLGCHAWRHLIGGKLNWFSSKPTNKTRYKVWKFSTFFNERHQLFAWSSLIWVTFADVYVRLCSMGVWTDLNTWGQG